jgi:hypothetical protein
MTRYDPNNPFDRLDIIDRLLGRGGWDKKRHGPPALAEAHRSKDGFLSAADEIEATRPAAPVTRMSAQRVTVTPQHVEGVQASSNGPAKADEPNQGQGR